MTVWAFATSVDPTTFTAVITRMMSAANTFAQTAFSPVNMALA